MSDALASLFLSFSHQTLIVPLVVVGYFWVNQNIFFHALSLVFLSMLLNVLLKPLFGVPLPAHLGLEGFAFPSGHMQTTVVFYSWIAYNLRHTWLFYATSFLLLGVGASLMHFGYHTFIDLCGASVCGFFLIVLYKHHLQKQNTRTFFVTTMLAATLMLTLRAFFLSAPVPLHVWMTFFGLLGLLVSQHFCSTKVRLRTKRAKLGALLLCCLILGLIYLFFWLVPLPKGLHFSQWFFSTASLPLTRFLASSFFEKNGSIDNLSTDH